MRTLKMWAPSEKVRTRLQIVAFVVWLFAIAFLLSRLLGCFRVSSVLLSRKAYAYVWVSLLEPVSLAVLTVPDRYGVALRD